MVELAARRCDSSYLAPSALADLYRIAELEKVINGISQWKNGFLRGNAVENRRYFGDLPAVEISAQNKAKSPFSFLKKGSKIGLRRHQNPVGLAHPVLGPRRPNTHDPLAW
jgi:hypothetical protein